MDSKNWLRLLLLSLLWGGSFFFVEVALTALPIFTIVFLRVFFGAVILLLIILISGRKLPGGKKIWLDFLVMGTLNNVIPFCMIVSGQRYISGGFASILNATTPFFTVVVAHILTKDEKLNAGKIAGVVLGIAGVSILMGFETVLGESNKLIGIIAVLCAAVSYAFAGIWGRRFKTYGITPLAPAAGQLICSAVLLFPIVIIVDRPWTLDFPELNIWVAVLGIALFSTALAYILYFKILASSGATNVLLVTFLVPVSAILLGVFILSEVFKVQFLLGMIIIGLGLIAIDGRLIQRIGRKKNVQRQSQL